MKNQPLFLLFAATLGVAVAGALVVDRPATAAATVPVEAAAADSPSAGRDLRRGDRPGRFAERARSRGRHLAEPVRAVVRDLRTLEHLYLLDGRAKEIPDLYRDLLKRTEHPMLRQFAYRRLTRLELRPTNTDGAIALARQSLEEDLKRIQ
ncbi:hypothetical protein [Tahibacter amnicola]|uniref:Uncharacterized protein n=1 Tax=Tahibacter amnicola TaxID=2976241 RepID=A0ABY6BG22_9GAMM|nr:hypothetical protein [Tahibacter amnicola]UXI67556.1 hypothetical protein N4264_22915 [Tahibacter amnicola]